MSEPVTYEYNELVHDYEGPKVPCRNCTTNVYLKQMASFGCHHCDATARDVTLKAKEDTNDE